MDSSIGCTLGLWTNFQERKIREYLELNKLEVKAKPDDTVKVLNGDWGNIVNTSSKKPLFRKINLMT